MKTLLHSCCAPCASACVPRLKEEGAEVAMLFANSNIDTPEEFERRRAEAERLARVDGVPFFSLPYDHEDWLRVVAAGLENEPERGRRCERCYRYNLSRAAAFAADNGFDAFTTSLTVSPHKPSGTILAIGRAVAAGTPSVAFAERDFKKRDGFKLSVDRSAELGLYRQNYCGCEFSRRGGGA